MSDAGYEYIAVPADGTAVANDANNKNVAAGLESCSFGALTPGTTYYFKIFGYTGTGISIDYKTNGAPLQTSIVAE